MKDIPRLPLQWAYVDPAFRACLDGVLETPEFIENYNRLYGASIGKLPIIESEMKAFVEQRGQERRARSTADTSDAGRQRPLDDPEPDAIPLEADPSPVIRID
ncbi:hypothetical protein [Burkholderia glumae]